MKDKDILTTIVRVKGSAERRVVSVKSSEPIDKSLWLELILILTKNMLGNNIDIYLMKYIINR